MKKLFASMLFLVFAALTMSLTACGKATPDPVSFNTLETARNQARENGLMNANAYRAESPRFTNHKIVAHGDSTQSPTCPQGDGWATNSIMAVNGKEVEKFTVKCSTVSASLGCYLDTDFAKKPFAKEEGVCQDVNKVPFPLPKLAS